MTLSLPQWHKRYQQQARWTQNLRKYIYHRVGIQPDTLLLDVGCGTGVLLDELSQSASRSIFGLDINHDSLYMAQELVPEAIIIQADALYLPYRSESFDITLCHFLLLWVQHPFQVIQEMTRVTRRNGYLLALAEPDYGGRIDYPEELSPLGLWQTESLREQGANPFMGRELRSLFSCAGLEDIEVGVLGGQWGEQQTDEDYNLEWAVIDADLSRNVEFIKAAEKLKELDFTYRMTHRRILYVPTFYAFGKVKG